MRTRFWIQRFILAFAGAFLIITGVEWLKGHAFEAAARHGLRWAVITAACYVGGQLYWARQGRACALCVAPAPAKPRD
jgi:hypothetical protein